MRDSTKNSNTIQIGNITDHLTDAERKKRNELKRASRPRVASTLVLTCGSGPNLKILMGQRSKKHDFMPSVYVFPGGRVDRADSFAKYAGDLSPRTERILEAAYKPRRARAVALACVRETYEETGLMLGQASDTPRNLTHASYDAFREAGQLPDLTGIEVFGRAVTPPHRHKRFDAWFFVKHLGEQVPTQISDSSELQNVGWFTFKQIEKHETQRATEMMLQVLKRFLKADRHPDRIFYSRAIRGDYKTLQFP